MYLMGSGAAAAAFLVPRRWSQYLALGTGSTVSLLYTFLFARGEAKQDIQLGGDSGSLSLSQDSTTLALQGDFVRCLPPL